MLRLQEHETLATRLGNVIAVFAGTGTWDPTAVTRFAVAATRKRKPPQSRTVSWAITDTVTASNDDLLRDCQGRITPSTTWQGMRSMWGRLTEPQPPPSASAGSLAGNPTRGRAPGRT